MATRAPNGFLFFCCSLAAVLVVAAFFVFSIAAGPQPGDLDAKRAEQRLAVRAKIEQEANDALTTEGWVDKAKGIVRVPVNGLLASTAKELAAKKPAPSQVKVEAPLPTPVVDPNSAEPPPPLLPSAPQGADMIRFASLTAVPAAPAAPAPPANPPASPTAPTAPPAAPGLPPAAPGLPPAAPGLPPAAPGLPPAAPRLPPAAPGLP